MVITSSYTAIGVFVGPAPVQPRPRSLPVCVCVCWTVLPPLPPTNGLCVSLLKLL